jgi:hypothetical protein
VQKLRVPVILNIFFKTRRGSFLCRLRHLAERSSGQLPGSAQVEDEHASACVLPIEQTTGIVSSPRRRRQEQTVYDQQQSSPAVPVSIQIDLFPLCRMASRAYAVLLPWPPDILFRLAGAATVFPVNRPATPCPCGKEGFRELSLRVSWCSPRYPRTAKSVKPGTWNFTPQDPLPE